MHCSNQCYKLHGNLLRRLGQRPWPGRLLHQLWRRPHRAPGQPLLPGFATFQLVRSRVPIYAIFHCHGYTSHQDCIDYLETVFALVSDRCLPKLGATVFIDGCFLRTLWSTSGDQLWPDGFCNDPTTAERWVRFNEMTFKALMGPGVGPFSPQNGLEIAGSFENKGFSLVYI